MAKEKTNKHFDRAESNNQLTHCQKQLIDHRLAIIAQHPERLKPVEELFDELDQES